MAGFSSASGPWIWGAFAQAATAFEEVEKLTGAPSWPSSTELKPSTSRTTGASTLPPGLWSIASSLPCRTSPSCLNSWPWMPSLKPAIERRRRPFAGCWRQGVTNPARRQFLEDAQRRAAELGGLDLAALGEAAPAGPGIAVDLTVAPAWLENLPAQAQLFILARPPGGRMPLAVERLNPATQLSVRLGPGGCHEPGYEHRGPGGGGSGGAPVHGWVPRGRGRYEGGRARSRAHRRRPGNASPWPDGAGAAFYPRDGKLRSTAC